MTQIQKSGCTWKVCASLDNLAGFCTKLNPAEAYLKPSSIWWNGPKCLETRPLSPDHNGKKSVAVAFLNKKTSGTQKAVFKLSDLGLDNAGGYRATEIFSGKDLGYFKPGDTFTGAVNPTGILLVKFSLLSSHHHRLTETDAETQPEIEIEFPGLTGWKSEF